MNNLSGGQKTGLAIAFLGVIAVGFYAVKTIKAKIGQSMKVIQVDTKLLDHVSNEKLLSNLFLLAAQAFDNLMKDGKASNQVALTLYSLYKQYNEGNADEFEDNKKKTKPERYAAWIQQVEKSGL